MKPILDNLFDGFFIFKSKNTYILKKEGEFMKSDFDKLSDENKEIISKNFNLVLDDFIRSSYAEYKVEEETTEKQAIKRLIRQMRNDKAYDRYTDKQLKKILSHNFKVMNDRMKQKIEDDKKVKESHYIVDVEL